MSMNDPNGPYDDYEIAYTMNVPYPDYNLSFTEPTYSAGEPFIEGLHTIQQRVEHNPDPNNDLLLFEFIRMPPFDPVELLKIIQRKGITMCGAGPIATVLIAAKLLGAQKVELIDYTHSGKVTNDNSSVVSYAGFIIT